MLRKPRKRIINTMLPSFLIIISIFIFSAPAVYADGIQNNGAYGIYIDIYGAPYSTTYADRGRQVGTAVVYGPYGCGWFASARVCQLTGKDVPLLNGASWWKQAENYGFNKGTIIPTSGKALICYKPETSNDGVAFAHVEVIEGFSGGNVIISTGGYSGAANNGYCSILQKNASSYLSQSNIQGFVYIDSPPPPPEPVLPDGDYIIAALSDTHYYLDIEGSAYPAASGTNVRLCYSSDGNVNNVDVWTVTHNGDGYYRIRQYQQNISLDVDNESAENGRNVQVWNSNNTSAQQWAISGSSSTGYRVQARCSGKYLEYENSVLATGTNVQQWAGADVPAQYWTFIPYNPYSTVTYDANGGVNPPSPQTKVRGTALTITSTIPTHDSTYDGGCTISFDANGGTVSPASKIIVFTKQYTFKNWNTAEDGSGTSYLPGSNYTIDKNVTLYAQWTSMRIINGIVLPTPTREGYTALGWADSKTATTAQYQLGSSYSYNASSSKTLYAVWEHSLNTITYDANGGENAPAQQTKPAGETIVLATDIPVRKGYTFLGWAESDHAGTAQYQPGESYSADADLTLYAVWMITNPPTLLAKDVSMLAGDTRDLTDFVDLIHDGVLNYTLIAISGNGIEVHGQRVTAHSPGEGWLQVRVVEYPAASCMITVPVTDLNNMLRLPEALNAIDEEAFANSGITAVTIPSGCRSIGKRAFADNGNLVYIYSPTSVTDIATDAFENSPSVTLYCYPGSAAAALASEQNIRCVLLNDDWVTADAVPAGATVTDEKWTYTRSTIETTRSTDVSMDGWTQTGFEWQRSGGGTHVYANYPAGFDTGHALYNAYAKSALAASETETTKREVSASAVKHYIFWHWTWYWGTSENKLINDHYCFEDGREYANFKAYENSYIEYEPGTSYVYWNTAGPEDGSCWWLRFDVLQQTYTDYQKIFTYTRTLTNEETSSTPVFEGDGISDIQHWVKYTL